MCNVIYAKVNFYAKAKKAKRKKTKIVDPPKPKIMRKNLNTKKESKTAKAKHNAVLESESKKTKKFSVTLLRGILMIFPWDL